MSDLAVVIIPVVILEAFFFAWIGKNLAYDAIREAVVRYKNDSEKAVAAVWGIVGPEEEQPQDDKDDNDV